MSFLMCGCCGVIERTNAHVRSGCLAVVQAGCGFSLPLVPRRAMLLAAAVSGRGCIFGGQGSLRAFPVHSEGANTMLGCFGACALRFCGSGWRVISAAAPV